MKFYPGIPRYKELKSAFLLEMMRKLVLTLLSYAAYANFLNNI